MKLRRTLKEEKQKKADSIVKSVLNQDYISLSLKNGLVIEEDVEDSTTKVAYEIAMKTAAGVEILFIKGSGHGAVDAFFSSLKSALVGQYESLKNIVFREFAISADMGGFSQKHSGSNSAVEAVLVVQNKRHEDLIFRKKSRSTNKAALSTVLSAIEHFINSEKAVIILENCIKDAKKRNRGDLVNSFTMQLSEIVKNNSYEKVLQKKSKK